MRTPAMCIQQIQATPKCTTIVPSPRKTAIPIYSREYCDKSLSIQHCAAQSSNQTYETANQVATPCGLAKEPIKLTHNSNARIHHSLLSKLQLTFIRSSASFHDVFHMQHAFILDLKCSPCSEWRMLSSG
jgi:hypothetical protein